jgi:hypothetical protein
MTEAGTLKQFRLWVCQILGSSSKNIWQLMLKGIWDRAWERWAPGRVKVRVLPAAINFIKIIHALFWYEILAQKITKLCFGFDIFWCKNIGAKCACKMLMKLTPG